MHRSLVLVLGVFLAGCAAPRPQLAPASAQGANLASPRTPGENSDLELGGFGLAPGQFVRLRDLTFSPGGELYTLESAGREKSPTGDVMGLGRVQVFDGQGHFERAFSLGADAQGDNAVNAKNEDGPMSAARLALDGQGNVYVSFPVAGLVRVFDAQGRKLSDIPLPNALALARTNNGQVVAIASRRLIESGHWTWKGGDALITLSSTGIEQNVPLAQTLWNVQDVAVAPNGDVLVLGAPSRDKYDWNPAPLIVRFNTSGQVVKVLGSGKLARSEDGSEPLHSLVVFKNGDIAAMTWGNPGKTILYSADGQRIIQTFGWFKWADSWSQAGSYTILANDPSDRLWVGVAQPNDPRNPNHPHDRPVVLRAAANFFAPGSKNVHLFDTRALGFAPTLTSPLRYNIAYQPNTPLEADVVVPPAKRNVSQVSVAYRVFDPNGAVVASGEHPLALVDGQEARLPLSFTPPRYGSYALVADFKAGQDVLSSQAIYFGVTPRSPKLPELKDSPGGWEDAPRQAFVGLRLMRLHPDKGLDKLDADLAAAQANNDLAFVQLTDKKDNFSPERATEVMSRLKGRVRYVELFNEPNFKFKPDEYVRRAQPVYDAIKAVDPTVQVLGPAVCGISLPWHEAFYKAGGKTTCDIVSVHDYEGHESISPEHWTWKLGALRALMAKYGDAGKPIWQTERAISSVRGGLTTGLSQAIRITLHRDLLSSLGISDDHNAHYYLNQGGYSDVPSYVWCDQGPLPAALALRTRAAMIGGRPFSSTLDFGPTGNTLFLGALYRDANGTTVSLRNLAGGTLPVRFAAPPDAQVFDAWGNAVPGAIRSGVLTLNLEQLPTYVLLRANQTLRPQPWNWGADLALGAGVSSDAQVENDPATLTNGQLKTIHADNPRGGTDGKSIVFLKGFSKDQPASVSLQLPQPTRFNAVIVRGVRADNQFSALLDFDVQARQNGTWTTVATYKSNVRPSVLARQADATAITFYGDDNAYVLRFPAVQSDAVRLVVRQGTFGFAPDETARTQVVRKWGDARPQAASLREIEIYNAP